MKTFTTLTLLTSLVSARPWEVISKRALTERDLDTRGGCPRALTAGQFEFPHYITQISSSERDRSFGPQYNGVFTPNDVASIFSFDIPPSRADGTCMLEFLFPMQSQLVTSSFSYSGGGSFFITGYAPGSCPGPGTTYNAQPMPGPNPTYPPIHMEPGNAYTINMGRCTAAAGTCVAAVVSTNDTNFSYFQDYNDCPIGLYVSYV